MDETVLFFFHRSLSLFLAFFVVSCGGDDPEPTTSDEDTSVDLSTEDSTEPELDTTNDEPVVPPPPSTKKEDAPDPNGVFLPIYEIKDENRSFPKRMISQPSAMEIIFFGSMALYGEFPPN